MKLLIADDHILVRKGLLQVLELQKDLDVSEAGNGEEALRYIRSERPEIALLDVEMPVMSGFDVARRVQAEGLSTVLVFLTMFKEETVFNKAMDLGVRGYVLKENTISEVLQCIRTVAEGRYYLSPSISDFLVRRNSRMTAPVSEAKGLGQLTPAERNVLKLVGAMKSSQQIADALGISVKTVQNHRNNICDKLGLQGHNALLKFAVDNASFL